MTGLDEHLEKRHGDINTKRRREQRAIIGVFDRSAHGAESRMIRSTAERETFNGRELVSEELRAAVVWFPPPCVQFWKHGETVWKCDL